MITRRKRFQVLLLAVLCFFLVPLTAYGSGGQKENKVVRVGYIAYDQFIQKGYNGYYDGYGVAYLNKIAQYTGWQYEYVKMSWEECQTALENGEIDLLFSAQWTGDRADRFAYSDYPVGKEFAIVYARAGNHTFYYKDYEAMDNARVAMLSGTYQNEQFAGYAEKMGFSYTPVFYETVQEVREALENGETDLAVLGSLTSQSGLDIVDKLGAEPFYAITAKDNRELLDELNSALENLNSVSPYLEEELNQLYFGNNVFNSTPLITRAEAEYIEQMPALKVACIDGFYPLSYRDEKTGEPKGVLTDLTREIAKLSGLNLELVSVPMGNMPDQLIKEGQADLVSGVLFSQEMMEDSQVRFTDIVFTQPALLVKRSDVNVFEDSGVSIALCYDYVNANSILTEELRCLPLVYKETIEECFKAVEDGEVSATVQNTYVANHFMQMKQYEDLQLASIQSVNEQSCIMLSSDADSRLLSILNKTISCLGSDVVNQIVMKNTTSDPYHETFFNIIYYYRWQVAAAAIFVLMAIVVLLVWNSRRTAMKVAWKEKEAYRIKAETDEMTGLLNRKAFYEKAVKLMKDAPEKKFQIVFFNVENFKVVNDLFGVKRGDLLLKFLAQTISGWSESMDGVASRFEADHFVVCMEQKEGTPADIMERLGKGIEEVLPEIMVDISCGVYHVQPGNDSINIMCDRAHLALDSIKGNHLEHIAVYDESHRKTKIQEQIILSEMAAGFEKKQFKVYLQPKYNMETGCIIGAEALVRWVHPERGVISPGEFIPVFERNGVISQLDFYMFEETCRLLRKWEDENRKLVPVSVNLSRVGFFNPKLCEHLCGIIKRYGISTSMVELEVTETAYAMDSAVIHSHMESLRNQGFKILMDDFGSGYSSLNMLKEVPIDQIKLDMKFLSAEDPYDRARTIIRMVIAMGNKVGIPVLAEGVETESQVEMLKNYQCHLAQGFYYSKPLTVEEFEKLME